MDDFFLTPHQTTQQIQMNKDVEKLKQTKQTMEMIILVSSNQIDPTQLLPLYRERDMVEKHFDTEKNEIDRIPLQVHKENTFEVLFFILFISMIIQFYLFDKMKQGKGDTKFSIIEIFFELH